MRLAYKYLLALCVGAAAAGGLVACVDDPASDDHAALPDCTLPQGVVDKDLLAFLSKAKSVHMKADLAVVSEDTDQAIAALEDLVDGQVPHRDAPETREVVADTLARLAELKSGLGQFRKAEADVARGLKLAHERTHYRGRLMEVLGEVHKRHHDALKKAGDEQGAKEQKELAVAALQEAINIQEEVIAKALSEPAPSP